MEERERLRKMKEEEAARIKRLQQEREKVEQDRIKRAREAEEERRQQLKKEREEH